MKRVFSSFILLFFSLSSTAHAGIDEVINNATKPIAELIGSIVFFKITVFETTKTNKAWCNSCEHRNRFKS